MQLDKSFGFDKKGASIRQNRVTTQQLVDGITQINSRNIVMGKVVDLNQVLYGYTISDSTSLDEDDGMLDNNELAEIKYNDSETGLTQAVYVRIPLIHDHLDDPLSYEIVGQTDVSAADTFKDSGKQSTSSLTGKKLYASLASHTRCTVDPTVANPTTQIHKNQFVGVRFLDYGYKYAHIVTLPNQSQMWSAITAGDLSPIFGVGSGVGFSGAASAATVGNYVASPGSMILIGASTLTSATRVSGIQKRLKERNMDPKIIQIAKDGGGLAYANSGFDLAKGGTNIRWFIPQLIKVLGNEQEKQRYSSFKYVIFGYPNSNDMLQVPGADAEKVISNTQSALDSVGSQIDPISKKPLKDFLKPQDLGKWFKDCLKLLCPSADVIYCPCAMRWGGASACQDYDSNFSYIRTLGYYENFKIIKHVVIGSHHIAGEDNTNRDTSITFSKIIGSGGTSEPDWNKGNGITGISKQTDAWVDIAQGVAKNHFINSNSQYPAEAEVSPLPISDNLRRFCKENYSNLEGYLKK